MMTPRGPIAEIVASFRKSKGLTQADVPTASGLGGTAIHDLENGRGTTQSLARVMLAIGLDFNGLPIGATLGAKVRTLRQRRGWSVTEAASIAGVGKNALRRPEGASARIETLERVLDLYGCILTPRRARSNPHLSDERYTPADFLALIENAFGLIDLDPCWHPLSAVQAARSFVQADDGLAQPWCGGFVFVNPPYSNMHQWVHKAHREWRAGNARTVALLIPVRTWMAYFHNVIAPYADTFALKRRLVFVGSDAVGRPAPFPCMLCVFGATPDLISKVTTTFDGTHWPPSRTRSA